MLNDLLLATGELLTVEQYLDDFWRCAQELGGTLWKLERRQEFRQPETPSWVALDEGDEERSICLTEENLDETRMEAEQWPFLAKRVRVVERPFTKYLRWELMRLHHWADFGEEVRVVETSAIKQWEANHMLPELVTLGDSVGYEVLYDSTGILTGARKIPKSSEVKDCVEFISDLFGQAESLTDFLEREPNAELRVAKQIC